MITFNQEACLKPYIDMNTELRIKAKNDFQKDSNWWVIQFLEKLWKILETCNDRKEKKLLGVRTKLSYYKVFHRKIAGYSNQKNSNTCLFISIGSG